MPVTHLHTVLVLESSNRDAVAHTLERCGFATNIEVCASAAAMLERTNALAGQDHYPHNSTRQADGTTLSDFHGPYGLHGAATIAPPDASKSDCGKDFVQETPLNAARAPQALPPISATTKAPVANAGSTSATDSLGSVQILFVSLRALQASSVNLFAELNLLEMHGLPVPKVVLTTPTIDSDDMQRYTSERHVLRLLHLPLQPAYLSTILYQWATPPNPQNHSHPRYHHISGRITVGKV